MTAQANDSETNDSVANDIWTCTVILITRMIISNLQFATPGTKEINNEYNVFGLEIKRKSKAILEMRDNSGGFMIETGA